MIAIVDYGMGNLRSVEKAVEYVGGVATITSQVAMLETAQGVILPGVGAFGNAMANLRARQLIEPRVDQISSGKPFLGICLGMHLLFEEGEEMGHHEGLGVLAGRVVRFRDGGLKVPHIGWNELHVQQQSPILAGVADGSYAYFVHSYYVIPRDAAIVVATTQYGMEYASVVGEGSLFGAQFHPEKSQEVGLRIMRNFVGIVDQNSGSVSTQQD